MTAQDIEVADLPKFTGGLDASGLGQVYSKYGFKVIAINGKSYWTPATEEDYREAESERLEIPPEQVGSPYCTFQGGICIGACFPSGTCGGRFVHKNKMFYCSCR